MDIPMMRVPDLSPILSDTTELLRKGVLMLAGDDPEWDVWARAWLEGGEEIRTIGTLGVPIATAAFLKGLQFGLKESLESALKAGEGAGRRAVAYRRLVLKAMCRRALADAASQHIGKNDVRVLEGQVLARQAFEHLECGT